MLLEIGTRRVGPGQPLFAIAEIGLNHGGSLVDALAMVKAAAAAGASAVKLQTMRA
jgi:sialic acid synthase SpsE